MIKLIDHVQGKVEAFNEIGRLCLRIYRKAWLRTHPKDMARYLPKVSATILLRPIRKRACSS